MKSTTFFLRQAMVAHGEYLRWFQPFVSLEMDVAQFLKCASGALLILTLGHIQLPTEWPPRRVKLYENVHSPQSERKGEGH